MPIAASITPRAIDAMNRRGPSLCDALVRAAALRSGVLVLDTEEFQAGRDVEGVGFVNLFDPSS